MEATINLNLKEEAEYIAVRTGFGIDDALSFVYSEDKFLDEKGINVYDGNNADDEAVEIYDDELIEFIEKDTGLNSDKIEKMLEAENEYFVSIGLIG